MGSTVAGYQHGRVEGGKKWGQPHIGKHERGKQVTNKKMSPPPFFPLCSPPLPLPLYLSLPSLSPFSISSSITSLPLCSPPYFPFPSLVLLTNKQTKKEKHPPKLLKVVSADIYCDIRGSES